MNSASHMIYLYTCVDPPLSCGSDLSAHSVGRSEVSCDRNRELKKCNDAQRPCFGMVAREARREGSRDDHRSSVPLRMIVSRDDHRSSVPLFFSGRAMPVPTNELTPAASCIHEKSPRQAAYGKDPSSSPRDSSGRQKRLWMLTSPGCSQSERLSALSYCFLQG